MNTQEITEYICEKGEIKNLGYMDYKDHPKIFGRYLTSNPNDVSLSINDKVYNFWMEGTRYAKFKVKYLDQETVLCEYYD